MKKLTQKILKGVYLPRYIVEKTPRGGLILSINGKRVNLPLWMIDTTIERHGYIKVSYVSRFQHKCKCAGIDYYDFFPEEIVLVDESWNCHEYVPTREACCTVCGKSYHEFIKED